MMGYMYDEANTRKTIAPDNWLSTGDVVSLKSYATGAPEFLKITGRVKELIITAGGENIAPVPIENQVKEDVATGSATEELVGEALLVDPSCKTVSEAMK